MNFIYRYGFAGCIATSIKILIALVPKKADTRTGFPSKIKMKCITVFSLNRIAG